MAFHADLTPHHTRYARDVPGGLSEYDLGDDIEISIADSGYVSAAPPGATWKSDAEGVAGMEDDSDPKTVISAATTIAPAVAQQSIFDVCNNIYHRIQPFVNHGNMDAFFDALPELIKAFAIRFAHCDSSDINRRIMHVVYSRHL